MNRLDLFTQALAKSEELQREYPELQTLQSIVNQLRYLIAIERGEERDRSRLREIILGVQAAREIEQESKELADLLHQVSGEVYRMR